MLGCFRTKFTDNDCVELYINKLFRLTSEETQRLAYSYRDILVTQENKHTIAHQAMLSVLQIRNIMSRVSRTARDEIAYRISVLMQLDIRTLEAQRPPHTF